MLKFIMYFGVKIFLSIFSVTVESTGALMPDVLVLEAIDVLKDKCTKFLNELKSLKIWVYRLYKLKEENLFSFVFVHSMYIWIFYIYLWMSLNDKVQSLCSSNYCKIKFTIIIFMNH